MQTYEMTKLNLLLYVVYPILCFPGDLMKTTHMINTLLRY